jgi:hypothetical protein
VNHFAVILRHHFYARAGQIPPADQKTRPRLRDLERADVSVPFGSSRTISKPPIQ